MISAINLFPGVSPNDVLNYIEYPPNYSLEHFDAVLKTIDYQIKDYQKQLDIRNKDCGQKSNIEGQILNREYAKKRIFEVRAEYYNAKDKYTSFCESNKKVIFDLYAGQDVHNCLVRFDVVIHNIFVSGIGVGRVSDPMDNIIEVARRKLINSMRNDLGINGNYSI